MADSGYYEKRPRRGSIETLLKYLKSHKFVADAFMETEQTMIVRRPAKGDLRVHLTNLYIVGIADVHEILGEDPTINAIVTMSHWNGYTTDAKSLCSEQDVGLFKFGEFLGAAYYGGKKFVDYAPPSEEEREKRRRRY